MLNLKVVKIVSKIIILLQYSKYVTLSGTFCMYKKGGQSPEESPEMPFKVYFRYEKRH